MPPDALDVPACLERVRQQDADAARALVEHLHPLVIKIVRALQHHLKLTPPQTQKLASISTAVSDQPFTVDANADKPVALKGGEAGLIVLPDKHLTADSFANAGKTITPAAQLWTYRVALASGGKSVEGGKVRTVRVSEGDQTKDVLLFLVGVVKNEQGAGDLVIFGKGREPVLHVSLKKGSAGAQDFPIGLSGQKTGDDSATLTLNLPGQFTADLGVVKAD